MRECADRKMPCRPRHELPESPPHTIRGRVKRRPIFVDEVHPSEEFVPDTLFEAGTARKINTVAKLAELSAASYSQRTKSTSRARVACRSAKGALAP